MLHLVFSLFLSFSHAQEVGNISYEEQKQVITRVESLSLTSISFGPAFANDMNNDDLFYSLHFGYHWEPSTHAEIRLNVDGALASKNEGNWLSGSLGGAWFLLTSDISPVIGAEFGYGYAHIDRVPDASGFMVGGFVGVRLFRTSNAQMSIEYAVQRILDSVDPTMHHIRFGILF